MQSKYIRVKKGAVQSVAALSMLLFLTQVVWGAPNSYAETLRLNSDLLKGTRVPVKLVTMEEFNRLQSQIRANPNLYAVALETEDEEQAEDKKPNLSDQKPASQMNQSQKTERNPLSDESDELGSDSQPEPPPADVDLIRPQMGADIVETSVRIAQISARDDDMAYLVIVVVGVFVVAALAVYTLKYGYDLATHDPKWFWWEVGLAYNEIEHDVENGHLTGVKLDTGYRTGNPFGLSLEVGRVQSYFELQEGGGHSLEGGYFAVGPALRWVVNPKINPDYFSVDLLLGTTENEEVGLLSLARLGYGYGLTDHFRITANFGTIYLNLKRSYGLSRKVNDFNYLLSFGLGYRF